jgi:hypothetical protein
MFASLMIAAGLTPPRRRDQSDRAHGGGRAAAETLERDPDLVERVVALARDGGVLTRSLRGCALHLSPPFTIAPEEVERIVAGIRPGLGCGVPG